MRVFHGTACVACVMHNGPIVAQVATDVLPDDTIATHYSRIEELGLQLLVDHLPRLVHGTAILKPQDESRRRLFPQRGPEDGKIAWSLPAYRIHDFIRAQTRPYPGAFSHFRGSRITLWQSVLRQDIRSGLRPGELGVEASHIVVGCGDGHELAIVLVGDGGQDIDAMAWAHKNSIRRHEGFDD